MKRITVSALLLLVCVQAWAWKPLFVGHRGCYHGVENTVEAFRNGVDEYGYDGLECDVRVTLDGEYVISHDDNTTRLGGNLTVASATLAQLKAEKYTQTRGGVTYTGTICTIDEYLDICVEKNVFPVIELKSTTGINGSTMTNFPGLAKKIIDHGLADKVVILTSMQKSLEYVKTNYPQFQAQYLCAANWSANASWCRHYDLNPSIQSGYFDIETVNYFRRLGRKVAVWTVDSEADYKKYGNMGVYMMTCNYLRPSQMPDLEEINWGNVGDTPDPLQLKCDTMYSYTLSQGNLPTDFPSRNVKNSAYNTAMQAVVVDGTFYTNDCKTHTMLAFGRDGSVACLYQGTSGTGIACDEAGNMILRADSMTTTPSQLVIYPKGSTVAVPVTFSLLNNGQTYFISASGNVMSEDGGYVYFYPKGQNRVNMVKIAQGKYVATYASGELGMTGMNTSLVVPIEGDTAHFVYQSRTTGINLYKNGDKGEYITGSSGTYAPSRNTSVGFAQFELGGHTLAVHPSGGNYNGGFTVRDMSSDEIDVLNIDEMGNGGLSSNQATGSFFTVEPIDDTHCYLYVFTMGNGYACYQLYVGEPYNPSTVTGDVNGDGVVDIADVNAVIDMILGLQNATAVGDVNGDGNVDVADMNAIIDIVLGL
ncbi:MAG: hypothetical protein KBT09_08045 [Bacteroidales bacterium]|nr:hypothetical protein [Candidatus Sodaliphilus fimicaballi]